MSDYTPKDGHVTIWKNEKYEKGGLQPYAKGTGKNLQGIIQDYTLWIPKSDKVKGFNLVISEPYKKTENKPIPENAKTELPEDDLPF